MSKIKTVFVCSECGSISPKWLGKCQDCDSWNTMVEEVVQRSAKKAVVKTSAAVSLCDISVSDEDRYTTGIGELDRVLGGGMVKGSLILVSGDPGIGKSTLVLQLCCSLSKSNGVLYVSGEESSAQIKLRADRLGIGSSDLKLASETGCTAIEQLAHQQNPGLLIIDSVQTVYDEELTSAPGSVSQVREVTLRFMKLAKTFGITVILIGHVTKEGAIAGPRVLEHMVDTVLYFEGERHMSYRILRSVKNRYGSTNEIGIFEMSDNGLTEVQNPSSMLLSQKPEGSSGSVVIASMEGSRPMLIEIQALVCETVFGMPRRTANGIDHNRVSLLIAVIEKKAGLNMHDMDAYVNVAGGIKINEPASDLGVIAAIASSFKNLPIIDNTVVIGEVGLTGEVRAVGKIEKRVMEAYRTGFKRCIIPANNYKAASCTVASTDIELIPVETVAQALDALF